MFVWVGICAIVHVLVAPVPMQRHWLTLEEVDVDAVAFVAAVSLQRVEVSENAYRWCAAHVRDSVVGAATALAPAAKRLRSRRIELWILH